MPGLSLKTSFFLESIKNLKMRKNNVVFSIISIVVAIMTFIVTNNLDFISILNISSYFFLIFYYCILVYYHISLELLEEHSKNIIYKLKDKKTYINELIDLNTIREKFNFYMIFAFSIIILLSIIIKILHLNFFFIIFTIILYSSIFSFIFYIVGKKILSDYKDFILILTKENMGEKILSKDVLDNAYIYIIFIYSLSFILNQGIYGSSITNQPLNLVVIFLLPLILIFFVILKIDFDILNINEKIANTIKSFQNTNTKDFQKIDISKSETELQNYDKNKKNISVKNEEEKLPQLIKKGTKENNIIRGKIAVKQYEKKSKVKNRIKIKNKRIKGEKRKKPKRVKRRSSTNKEESLAELLMELDKNIKKLANNRGLR